MAIPQTVVNRFLLRLVLFAMPAFALAQSDCIFSNSFECGPDVKGPTIRIIEPESWVTDRTVAIEFEDESGLAGYATQGFAWDADWRLFWEQPKTATKEYTLNNLGDLLSTGAEVRVVAQDIHGNFSRQSVVFTADSAITPGTYTLAEPFVSEIFSTENCSSWPSALPYQYEVDSIDVAIFVSNWGGNPGGCSSGEPCVRVSAGSFASRDVDGNIVGSVSGVGEAALQNFETDLQFSEGPRVQGAWSGGGDDGSVGSSMAAVFTATTPQEITAEVTFYCSNRYSSLYQNELFENGCPEDDTGCVVETFSFTVQGQLQPN